MEHSKHPANPYAADAAYSACFTYNKGNLTHCFNDTAADPRTVHIHHQFRALVESPAFPCVGAKAALKQNSYRFGFYGAMDDPATIKGLCHDLEAFARMQKQAGNDFTTFIACFDNTVFSGPTHFEDGVWKLLGTLCSRDSEYHAWDAIASADLEQPDFAFSFAQTSYFIAALSPVSPRMSRRFVVPALVFNAHFQFQHMREKGIFDSLRDKIRARDTQLENGVKNPLARGFGEAPGGVQYCGIPPADGQKWQCPFHKYFTPQGGKGPG